MITRLVSAAAASTILAAHFISAAIHQEIYMDCAASYFNRLMATLGQVMPSLEIFFAYSGLAVIVCALIIAAFAILTNVTLGLSVILLIVGNRTAVVRAASVAFYLQGMASLGGCCWFG